MARRVDSERELKPVAAVVLAAGRSSRMGAGKPLLRWGGETLLARSIRAAREGGCGSILVVAGANFDDVAAEARARGALVCFNSAWSEGMGTSIAAGVRRAAEDPRIEAALLMTCDQPLVAATDLLRIMSAFRRRAAPIAASDYGNGSFGIPAIFGRALFSPLSSLSGDRGARNLIERERGGAIFVNLPAGAIDLDTPEEWERFRKRFRPSGYRTRSARRGRRRSSSHPEKS